ncbi:UDP-glucose 4-epimerase [Streptococcus mitis 13/39]|uniref:UDP-glucose 4-epimerase n=1 Tax=Streptococcus mitis 13/39 TaxID=1239793 RepID=R0MCE8_STRMT|nr:UDP-glucose 4-epimerase [Streptococcus mitis 13/39]
MQEKILVTGGAGFIGTHTVIELIQAGHQVVVVDNLVNSNRKSLEVVERITGVEVPFYEADIRDTDTLRDIFKQEEPTGVIHFAGLKLSVNLPVFLLPTMTTISLELLVF